VAGGLLLGVGAGGVVGGALGTIGWVLMESGAQEDVDALVGFAVGGAIGYTFGNAIAVRWFENRKYGPRGLKGPLLGTLVGVTLGGGLALACGDSSCAAIAIPAALALPPVGALVGYFRSPRSDSP
jgi:hypothetical protein